MTKPPEREGHVCPWCKSPAVFVRLETLPGHEGAIYKCACGLAYHDEDPDEFCWCEK